MKQLINNYKTALGLLETRLTELSAMHSELEAAGEDHKISELDLDRRISLLQTEIGETRQTIAHLSAILRRREPSVQT